MKKYAYILPIVFTVVLLIFFIPLNRDLPSKNLPTPTNEASSEQESAGKDGVSIANPASTYCQESGGTLEIITNRDGSQFGLCQLEDYSCEEWAYLRGECTIQEDAEKITQALVAKGLNLTDMKVVIHKHLGKYISGSVVPVSAPAGGGYVFATKDESGNIQILADGNGAIMCTMLESFQDFPAYLIPECIDESGNPVVR